MGISRVEAWAIQANEVHVEAFKSKAEEKYGMAIYHMKDGEIDRLSIDTKGCPYSSEQEAMTAGVDLVNAIRGMDLGNPYKVLESIISRQTAEEVGKVVNAAKK